MAKIVFNNVTKYYNAEKKILDDVSYTLDSGGFYFLIGKSGSGKTTILRLIHLLETPNDGSIFIDDAKISSKTKLSTHRSQIGFVFQDYRLIETQTAEFNIQLPLYISKLKQKRKKELFLKTVDSLNIGQLLKKRVNSLSGGEKQLISIARAIVTQPKILLVDEPSAHLDRKNSLKILNILLNIQSLGITLILATHDIDLIKSTQDTKIMILNNGKIEFKNN